MSSDVRASALRPPMADVALAALAAVFCISGAALVGARPGEPNLNVWAVLLLIAQCAPLAWRQRAPLVVLPITGVAAGLYGIADWPDPLIPLGAFIGLASVVEFCSRRAAITTWLISLVAIVVSIALAGDSDAIDVWGGAVLLIFAPLVGDHQRGRRAYTAAVQASAERLERDRQRDIRAAQLAERSHLARELHDVVAHHVSMMVVQAEAGASVAASSGVDGDGDSEAEFDAIAATGRETLAELRTLLGILRTDGQPAASKAPQPGIESIGELVDQVRLTGLDIELAIEGEPRDVSPAVGLSAYRVVQEGLTNVIKHAAASKVNVLVRYEPTRIQLDVYDNGSASAIPSHSPGHGLDGLRERVALLHGQLTTRRRPSGGFELNVQLPDAGCA